MRKKTYALQLSLLRNAKGLTQQQVADKIGITRGRLNNYEQGTREPDIDTITLLAKFYNVSIGCLLGRDESNLIKQQELEVQEALALFHKIKNLSPEKRKVIEILTNDEHAALTEAQ